MDRLGVNKPHEDCSTGVVEETRHKGRVRGKVNIEYIEDIKKRRVTFSKRKAGIMKKAYELSELTGTEVLLLVVSETERVHSFSTSKLLPIVTKTPGKELIQECLNTPDEMESQSTVKSPQPDTESIDERFVPSSSSSSISNTDVHAHSSSASPDQTYGIPESAYPLFTSYTGNRYELPSFSPLMRQPSRPFFPLYPLQQPSSTQQSYGMSSSAHNDQQHSYHASYSQPENYCIKEEDNYYE